jgi:hypothetical protein
MAESGDLDRMLDDLVRGRTSEEIFGEMGLVRS